MFRNAKLENKFVRGFKYALICKQNRSLLLIKLISYPCDVWIML